MSLWFRRFNQTASWRWRFIPLVDFSYPHIESTGVWDVVVNVTVVTQTDDAETYQGTHIEGKDWDE